MWNYASGRTATLRLSNQTMLMYVDVLIQFDARKTKPRTEVNSLKGKKVAPSRHSINFVIFAHSPLTYNSCSLERQLIHICIYLQWIHDLKKHCFCQSGALPTCLAARCFSSGNLPSVKSFATRTRKAAWECHQENLERQTSKKYRNDIHFDDINEEIHIVNTYCIHIVTVLVTLKLKYRTVADLMRNWATYNPSEVGEV